MKVKFVLSVIGGIVKEVYEVDEWYKSTEFDGRIEFQGKPANREIANLFRGKMIPEYYRKKGMLENEVYDGIVELLKDLNARGVVCVLATCKPHEFANRIIEHFDLAKYFKFVSGPEMDGTRNEKHEVIAYALENLNIPTPNSVLMVGDRRDDVVGAARCDMRCVGVEWGFGTKEELVAAGAADVVQKPQELLKFF